MSDKPTGKGGAKKAGGGSKSGSPRAHVGLKKKRGRTVSQQRWLERQLNDPYVQAARSQGYRSRAAYKLLELDDKFHFLKPGVRVVDLGACPGGWTQVAVERVRNGKQEGPTVLAVDISPMQDLPGAKVVQLDFLADGADATVIDLLGGQVDVVISDMAAPATGHRQTDHIRIMLLCEAAADLARRVLAPGGSFVAKVLRGGTENELLAALKRDYRIVRHVKPPASRQDSAESYVIAVGYRGNANPEA